MTMKHDWVSPLTGEQSGPTDMTVFRWLAAIGTIMTPVSVGFVTHYAFGFCRQEIRTPALVGAAIIGLLMATEYVVQALRKRNSNEGRDRSAVE